MKTKASQFPVIKLITFDSISNIDWLPNYHFRGLSDWGKVIVFDKNFFFFHENEIIASFERNWQRIKFRQEWGFVHKTNDSKRGFCDGFIFLWKIQYCWMMAWKSGR